jgi:hypothetical protein
MVRPPESRMDILTTAEIDSINSNSKLVRKYSEVLDRESAYEMLNKKLSQAVPEQEPVSRQQKQQKTSGDFSPTTKSVVKVLTSATFIRGAFGVLSKLLRK